MDREAPPTVRLEVIDTALLFDKRAAEPGVWLAAAPWQPQSGAVDGPSVYLSLDDDAYDYLLTLPNPTVIGELITELAFITDHGYDGASYCDVLMSHGIPSSITEERQLQGFNLALIGNEVLSFRTATLNADGSYRISGLIRGLRGTEANVETHAIATRFILLQPERLAFVPLDASLLGATLYFKAAYAGHDLTDLAPVTHEYAAANLAAIAPANVSGFRQASGDIKIKWERRTRLSHNPFLGLEPPIGQERTRYAIEIYAQSAPSVLIRTLEVEDAEEVVYTAAQQTTDGTTGVALNLNAWQYGDRAPSPAKLTALA